MKMALASGFLAYGMGDFEDFVASNRARSPFFGRSVPTAGPPLAAGVSMMSFLFQSTSKLQGETKVGDKLQLDFVSKSMGTKKHHTAPTIVGAV
ncbi:hypothetical protein [Levilactobacillus yonginensis]